MTDIDERIAAALQDAVPEPPRDLDPAFIRERAARRVLPLRRIAPALAAVAVVAVAVGVLLAVQTSGNKPPNRNVLPPPSGPVAASPRAITERTVDRLLAAAPLVPGADRVDSAPAPILRRPPETPASANLVARHIWWTTSRSAQDVLDYFGSHVPGGIEQNGSFNGVGDFDRAYRGLTFGGNAPEWVKPAVFTQLELLIEVTPYQGRTAVRVDAHAIWLPQRTAAETVPLAVTSVEVVVDRRGSAPTVRRTLAAAQARSLARVVNGLPVATPGTISCPMMRGFTDVLTFHSAHGVVAVNAEADGCGFVRVVSAPGDAPSLSGGAIVDHAVLRFFGLPRNYGW